jgi:hypothetical protein
MTTDEERNSVLIDLRSAINRIEGQAKSLMTYLDRLPVGLAEADASASPSSCSMCGKPVSIWIRSTPSL